MNETLFGSGEVARRIRMPVGSLLYRIRAGDLPDATHRVAGRRVFTAEDLTAIRAVLRANPKLYPQRRAASSCAGGA